MSRIIQAIKEPLMLEETVEEDSEIVRKYKRLEEKCDTVLAKIKKRKKIKQA